MLGSLVAAAAVAATPAPVAAPAEAQAVEGIEITTRRPVVGTLEQGVQAYRPEFFTPVRPSNAMDMIKWLPGFNFEDMRDLRGLGGSTGNVLIDGKPPTSKTDTLSTILARIPSDQVERVDIIVGGAPGIDMRGRDVIANVVMKKTTKTRGSATLSSFAFQDGRVAPEMVLTAARNRAGRSWDTSLTVNQRVFPIGYGDGTLVRRDAAGGVIFRAKEIDRGDGPSVIGTGSYEFPLAGGKLKVNGSGRWFRADIDNISILEGSGARQTLRLTDIYRQAEAGVRYERLFGGRTTLEAQLLERLTGHDQTNITRRPPQLTDFDETDSQGESVARATLRFKKDETLTLEGSAEGAFNSLDTRSSLLSAGLPVAIPAASVRVHEDRGEFGALASWKPSAKYGLTAGLKIETSTLGATGDVVLTRSLTYLKPRVLFSWSLAKDTQLRLRAEREVGQINFFNFTAGSELNSDVIRGGNPNLRPQKAWIAEAVLERQFWQGASAVLTLRQRALSDVVDGVFVPGTRQVIAGNIGDGRQTDLAATVTLPLKAIGLNGAMLKGVITRSWSKVTDPTTGERRPLSINFATIAELHFTYDLPKQKVNLGFDAFYNSTQPIYRPASFQTVGTWARMLVFVEYRIRPDFTVRLEAVNVTDAHPRQTFSTYAGARNVAPLIYADERVLGLRPYVNLKVRRSF